MDGSDVDGPRRPRRNPMVAGILSAVFFPGLGQIYCGRTGRGFIAMVGVGVVTFLSAVVLGEKFVVLGFVLAMLGAGVDAWRVARDT